ncbi:hypothetical protein, conserved [Thermococcus onnurineus NA1]|uniref:Uncharacterized protein n=1 Tax=Thermococcus onnurineus (strain NA1) TaxID=523850 RepID=B6YT05_THEON|nr:MULTISPECIES: hypothetical protein [Thermococcus]ACJ15692.1 hypothetical protein, conserved [Thermococcus onnurineus NA1]NJE46969.1 hypothetical protein [Thermococcus sp. GR7]NJE78979.1 hypothetical protein [Thermococcus sp. GR4]NJF22677.1 hypothetical protein [Thermococcus sp. GR5]
MSDKLNEALFEARPYVEYYEKLENLVKRLWTEAATEENFLRLLNEEIERAEEPFRTDLRIFLQKFEAL